MDSLKIVQKRFEQFGFPLVVNTNIIPDDDSTLFICSGMQPIRDRFQGTGGGRYGSLQSCIRTSDLNLIGDGSHLTYFKMLGNFSFRNHDYEESVKLWHVILLDLKIPVTSVHVHPDRLDHKRMWETLGYTVVDDPSCEWSDGTIQGNCCELFYKDLEIGNLVNPLGHSTDVGFGWERLQQIIEQKSRIDETSLFNQNLPPIARDHYRTLSALKAHGIEPGAKGRNYICRRLLRRTLDTPLPQLEDWQKQERELRDSKLTRVRYKKKFKNKSYDWWYETFGLTPEEVDTQSN